MKVTFCYSEVLNEDDDSIWKQSLLVLHVYFKVLTLLTTSFPEVLISTVVKFGTKWSRFGILYWSCCWCDFIITLRIIYLSSTSIFYFGSSIPKVYYFLLFDSINYLWLCQVFVEGKSATEVVLLWVVMLRHLYLCFSSLLNVLVFP